MKIFKNTQQPRGEKHSTHLVGWYGGRVNLPSLPMVLG